MPRIWIAVLGLLFAWSAITPGALAQSNSYKQTNLTSDTAGVAANVDPNLVNPWGIAFFPNNPFWIADNDSGFTTSYNVGGMNVGSFPVPAAAANTGPANFNSGAVEVYDNLFNVAHLAGTFTDPNLPSGFAPFGAWEREAKHAEMRKKAGAATRAGILQSGLLTTRRSARFQSFAAAFFMLPTETEGAVMVAVESQAGEVLFIGQPGYPVATLNELAREADAARRER